MRLESHQAPSRGCSTCSGALQSTRSAERERRIAPCGRGLPNPVVGRWKRIHLPSTRCGQQRRVLVLRLPDDPVALDGREVLGRREEDGGAGRAVDGAGDDPALELGDEDDARVLEAPLLALDSVGRSEQRLRVDRPAVDPVAGAGDGEVRDAGQVLDAGEQDGRRRSSCAAAGLNDGVDGIRPVLRGQDRVGRVAVEELSARSRRAQSRGCGGRRAVRPRRAAAPRGGRRASIRRPGCRSSSPRRGRRCSRRSRSRRAAGGGGCGRGTSRTPLRALRVLRIAGDGERGQLGRDERGGVERLLVAGAGSRLGAPAAEVTGQPQRPVARGPTRRRASEAPPARSRVRSSRPSATPPTISACGSRALS